MSTHNDRAMTLAHVSDLHLGRSWDFERRAAALSEALQAAAVDHVVVTGDITHRGRRAELDVFRHIFRPLADLGRLSIIPGNHDCLGDDVSVEIQAGPRVAITSAPGLHLVRFDSTGEHNRRSLIQAHGEMTEADVAAIAAAASAAPAGVLVAVLLHHHVLPFPADHAVERLTSWLGWPFAEELDRGEQLLEVLRGRCDLVLHGHRHIPRALTLFPDDRRPIALYNAGSSTELGRVRVFTHAAGRLVGLPAWLWSWTAGDRGRPVGPGQLDDRRAPARSDLVAVD